MILAAGDVTRHEEIKWGYTLKQCEPYLEYQERQILFREAILAFFGVGDEKRKRKSALKDYCYACKKAGLDNCDTCSRDFRYN